MFEPENWEVYASIAIDLAFPTPSSKAAAVRRIGEKVSKETLASLEAKYGADLLLQGGAKGTDVGLVIPLKATGFASQKAFREHWKKHVQKGDEWGVPMSESQYLARAKKFLSGPPDAHTLQYQRANGQTVRYSTRTGEYGIVGADGVISTLFRPATSKRGGDGLQYFLSDRMKNIGY